MLEQILSQSHVFIKSVNWYIVLSDENYGKVFHPVSGFIGEINSMHSYSEKLSSEDYAFLQVAFDYY